MATKPTKLTDWATDGAALTTATDVSRHDFGWQTLPDNLAGQPGEKPNLNQQNYWQLAVHEWQQYFETATDEIIAQLPDNTVVSITDLWRWDTSDISGELVDPYLDTIAVESGKLVWRYTDPSFTNDWDGNKADVYTNGRYWELSDMFGNGTGIQMVDGDDVIWTIIPTGVATSQGFPPTNNGVNALNMLCSIHNAASNSIFIELDPGVSFAYFTIHKNDGGTITTPSDFTDFTTLNTGNFDTKNPNGVRAVLAGLPDISTKYTTKAADFDGSHIVTAARSPRRMWVRTVETGNPAIATSGARYDMYIGLVRGRRYRMTFLLYPRSFAKSTADAMYMGVFQSRAGSRDFDELCAAPTGINANNGVSGATSYQGVYEFTCTSQLNRDLSLDGLIGLYGSGSTGEAKFLVQDLARVIIEEM